MSALTLSACSEKNSLSEIFISPPQSGLSEQTLTAILQAQEKLRAKPEDKKIPYDLAYLYLQAVRENADTDFYDRTERLISYIEKHDLITPENTFLRGLIEMGRHDFPAAYITGKKLVSDNPDVHRYYGLLADAEIELGKYDDAIKTLQTMADIRPDAATLTRIAYVREIHGDIAGAKESMEQAINQRGSNENIAWEITELARLWLPSDPKKAGELYDEALQFFPDFAPALAGKARSEIEQHKYTETAIDSVNRAITLLPLPEFAALLGDIYQFEGNTAKANAQYTLVTIGYEEIAKSGVNVSLEQIRFLVEHDLSLASALVSARAVYAERKTIYAADTLAWALYKNKNYPEAQMYAEKALATETHDPMILFHAAMIANANGNKTDAKKYGMLIQKESPHFSFLHEKELADMMKGL